MVAYTKAQQRKKEESERLRGEREIRTRLMILYMRDSSCRVQKRDKMFHKLHVLGRNDNQ